MKNYVNEYKLYSCTIKEKTPFILLCAGGAYKDVCVDVCGFPIAKKVNQMGFNVFVLKYHTKRKARNNKATAEVAKAVKHITENADTYGVESEKYSVWGFSAGGHLVGGYGTKQLGYQNFGVSKPSSLVLGYPVVTMGDKTHKLSCRNLLGFLASKEKKASHSIENLVDGDYPPTFVWHCKFDEVVNFENTIMLERSLKENDVAHECVIYEESGHGLALGIGTKAEGWIDKAVDFVRSHF